MRRGEIWVADLNPPRGHESGKVRPVLIVQADELISAATPFIIVLPMTSRVRAGMAKWRITIAARDRLLKDSQVMVDQPKTLERSRLGEGPLTRLMDSEMEAVESGLKVALGFM